MAVSAREAQIEANALTLNKQYQGLNNGVAGGNWGSAYISYMASHPTLAPDAVFDDFENLLQSGTEKLHAVPKAIESAVDGVVKAQKQIVAGTGAGLNLPSWAAGLANFLKDITQRDTWIRILKIGLGGAMMLIGVMHLSGVKDLSSTAAKVAGAAAIA